MPGIGPLVRIRKAQPLDNFNVLVTFEDGTEKTIDLEPFLRGSIFERVRNDPAFFRSLAIEGNTVAWPNGADIDPDVLYYGLEPAWKTSGERDSDQAMERRT